MSKRKRCCESESCNCDVDSFSMRTFSDRKQVVSYFMDHLETLASQRKLMQSKLNLEPVSRVPPSKKASSDARDCVFVEKKPSDKFIGCSRLRALRQLLGEIDNRGFERSDAQERFHEAFLRSCAKVIYKEEWGIHEKAICSHNAFGKIASGCLISTPRRFGKTFRYEPLAPPAHSLSD